MNQALEIEDIRRAIGEFMTPTAIIACAQVNRDWHASFIPLIWQSLRLEGGRGKESKYPPLEALEKNKHLIQGLSIQSCILIPYLSLQGCQQLTHLDFSGSAPCVATIQEHTLTPVPSAPDGMWYYWRLLVERHQSSLKSLSVSSQQEGTITPELLKAIGGCRRLETLRLSCTSIRPDHAGLFWKAISNVETLVWRGGGGNRRGHGGAIPDWIAQEIAQQENVQETAPPLATPGLISASTNTFSSETDPVVSDLLPCYSPSSPPPSRLRKLTIIQCMEKVTDWELFRHCQNIQSIEWELLRGNSDFPLDQFSTMLFEGAWPRLKELKVLNGSGSYHDDHWARLMESPLGSRLESLTVDSSMIGQKTFQVLFATGERLGQGNELRRSPSMEVAEPFLPRRLFNNSLSHIDLFPTSGVDSLTIQSMLSTLPSLESLRVGRLWYMDIFEGEPWICKNLKELFINIDMTQPPSQVQDRRIWLPRPGSMGVQGTFERQQRKVFQRLSTLTRLNSLYLHQRTGGPKNELTDVRGLDWELQAGLGQLTTLKNMSSLTFTNKHQNMGWPEIRWMVETWPGMRRLTGKFSQSPSTHFELKSYMNEHHVLVFDPPN